MPASERDDVAIGQVRRGPSGTNYRVVGLHGGYVSLVDADDLGILPAGENVYVSDIEFSASRSFVSGWELVDAR